MSTYFHFHAADGGSSGTALGLIKTLEEYRELAQQRRAHAAQFTAQGQKRDMGAANIAARMAIWEAGGRVKDHGGVVNAEYFFGSPVRGSFAVIRNGQLAQAPVGGWIKEGHLPAFQTNPAPREQPINGSSAGASAAQVGQTEQTQEAAGFGGPLLVIAAVALVVAGVVAFAS